MPVRRRAAVAGMALALSWLLLAGCREGPRAGSASTEPAVDGATEAGLRAFATQRYREVDSGSGDAYGSLSAACAARWTEADWTEELAEQRKFFKTIAGVELSEVTISAVEVRDVVEDHGEVRVRYRTGFGSDPLATYPERWVRFRFERGQWRLDDCKSLAESLSGG